jgi:hypothetical protein
MTACLTHRTVCGTSSSSVPFIKPPRMSNPSSPRSTSLFLLPPPTLSPALPSGQSTALPLASLQPVFGSSLMNVATKHSQSPSSSITSWVGSSTLGWCNFPFTVAVDPSRVRRGAEGVFFSFQSRSSLPFLAYNTCQTPCNDRAYDSRSGLCPTHPFPARPSSAQFRWREPSGCQH